MRNFTVIPEADFASEMDRRVDPFLESVRTDGIFRGCDGKALCWHSFAAGSPVANVVILHGYTESGEKYREMSWYFLSQGYSVWLYDQRGHGKSCRDVPDKTLTHVDSFDDYVGDLECFLEQIVPRDLPLFLYSHSMGGAVSALFLEKHPHTFDRAVLSSPMVAPSTGSYPAFAGRAICRAAKLFGGAKKRIFMASDYPGHEVFADSCGNSEPRFSRYELFRRTHEDYQNFSPTYSWTLESLLVARRILKKGRPERIETKVLILSGGRDTVVLIPPQQELAKRIPHCRYRMFPTAKHEIFISTDDIMIPYVEEILSFFGRE